MVKKTASAKKTRSRSAGKKATSTSLEKAVEQLEESLGTNVDTPLEELQFDITDDLPAYAHVVGLDDVDGETTVEVVEPKHHIHHRKHHPALLASLVLGTGLLIGAGWAGWTLWQQGSLSHYRVAGVEVAKNSDTSLVKRSLESSLKKYHFTVAVPGQKPAEHSPSEAGVSLDSDKTIASVSSAQTKSNWLEKLSFWRSYNLPLQLKVDETKLANFIKDHLVKTTVEPKNATLTTETGEVVITADAPGEGITITKPKETLLQLITTLNPSNLLGLSKQSILASVKVADLQPLKAAIDEVSATPIAITVNSKIFRPSQPAIVTWVDPVQEGATQARFEINSGKVAAWIDSITAQFTSPVQNEVHALNPDGTQKVLTTGRSGSEVAGGDQAAKDIVASLGKKQPVSKVLTIASKPYKVIDVNTYDKWLLADLSNHMLYAYEKDQLVKSFPMSAGAPETPTIVGEFKIYSKVRVQTMRGPNADGTSYNVPNVEWVSYFTGSYAIHGNYWRPLSVFGNVNTSHGCIGMVNANSQWVYEWAPIGTPVITYN